MSRGTALVAGLLWSASLRVGAVPPDRVVEMKTGEDLFLAAGLGNWQARSEDPRVAEAAAVGGEVHLRARERGRTLVLVENRKVGRLAVWLVLVEEKLPPKPQLDALPCVCNRPDPEEPPVCRIADQTCLRAIRSALAGGGITTAEVWIRYDLKGLQALLFEMQQRLRSVGFSRVEPLFAGANLRLQGVVADDVQRTRLIFELYRLMVGRLVLEDRLRLGQQAPEPPPDEGSL